MATPYQQSYGDDWDRPPDWDRPVSPGYWDDIEDDDLPGGWTECEESVVYRRKPGNRMWYDWDGHVWRCECPKYRATGRCKHALRFRRQVTVEVNREYL